MQATKKAASRTKNLKGGASDLLHDRQLDDDRNAFIRVCFISRELGRTVQYDHFPINSWWSDRAYALNRTRFSV